MCRLWPSIAPHGPQVPNSVWNLPYSVWRPIAASVDQYLADQADQQRAGRTSRSRGAH